MNNLHPQNIRFPTAMHSPMMLTDPGCRIIELLILNIFCINA